MTSNTTTPTRADVAATVRDYVAKELGIEQATIEDDTVLKELPGADSVRLLRIVSKLERHWDAEFEDEDIFKSSTLDELITLVAGYLGTES